MDALTPKRGDQDLGGAPEGLDALTVADRLRAVGGMGPVRRPRLRPHG